MNKNCYNQKRKMKKQTTNRMTNKNFTNNAGITLIALVITIVLNAYRVVKRRKNFDKI